MIILFFGKNKIHPRQFFFNQFKNLNHNIIYVDSKKNLILRSLFLIKFYFYKFDLIFISWPGFSDIFFIKILGLIKKKIIYDCFTLNY